MTYQAAVIIATRNNCDALRLTLESLEATFSNSQYSSIVYVIDNGSSDQTATACEESAVQVERLWIPKPGKSLAYNQSIDCWDADCLLFTDDDVRVKPDWIDRMAGPILDGTWSAVVGPSRVPDTLRREWMTPLHDSWFMDYSFKQQTESEGIIGLNFGVDRRFLVEHLRWDEQLGPGALGFCDDSHIGAMIRRAGGRIGVVQGAEVEHHFDESRLERRYLQDRADRQGLSSGYLGWHLFAREHRLSWLREMYFRMRLLGYRMSHAAEARNEEGCSETECKLREKIYYAKQYRRERRLPRKYQ
jgi:glycosyltransferase involved in cell wall biosynthesis